MQKHTIYGHVNKDEYQQQQLDVDIRKAKLKYKNRVAGLLKTLKSKDAWRGFK